MIMTTLDVPPRPHCPAVGKWSGPPRCNLGSASTHDGGPSPSVNKYGSPTIDLTKYKYSLGILRSLGGTLQFQTCEASL